MNVVTITAGGNHPVGVLGQVAAFLEFAEQVERKEVEMPS